MGTSPSDAVRVLSRALDQAGDVLARVHRDRFSDPTPCGDWDVAQLVTHLLRAPRNFVAMVKDEDPDWSAPTGDVPVDWTGDFRSAGDDLLHLWHQQGDAASPQTVDWQTAEIAIHTWDLARATGQSTELDPEVGQRALALMQASLKPEHRGATEDGFVFRSEVSVPEDAPVYERLAGFAGRDAS